jgi:hypothetical protein
MIDEIDKVIGEYRSKWQALMSDRRDKAFFAALKPISVGWKVADLTDYDKIFAELREHCGQMHVVWLNERWIATMVLRDSELAWGITIVKLMQRRPGSTDTPGLDHIDFYSPNPANAEGLRTKESDLKFTYEANGFCKWTSLWFAGTEAKLRNETTLDVCIAEMNQAKERILAARNA